MDAMIAMCDAPASYLDSPPDRIIYHGVNTEVYQPPEDKALEWQNHRFPGNPSPAGKYGIGILGRAREQKAVHLFVDACIDVVPKYPDHTAVIVGAASASSQGIVKELQDTIEQAGLSGRIVFAGEQDFADIPGIFRSLSLVAAWIICCATRCAFRRWVRTAGKGY